ncbi:MAG: PEP-CTERM sorting domain-containing protein [Gemmatimonadota bacterium]
MKTVRWLLLAAIALCVFHAPAQASDFLVRCSTGSIRTCASFQVITVPLVTGGTQVFVKVRNEGARGPDGSLWGQMLTRFGVIAPANLAGVIMENVVDNRGTIFVEDGATSTGAPATRWALNRSNTNSLGSQIDFAASTQNSEGGIKGCVAANSNPGNFYSTCVNSAPAGWVVFAFTSTTSWSDADAQLAWHVVSVGDGNPSNGQEGDLSIGGTTGPGDQPPPVVPEPATILLLGTGLVGIAGVHARRRKKKEGRSGIA